MSTYHPTKFTKFDDYSTPASAWKAIKQYIPKHKTIWEPFWSDGKSGEYLKRLGFKVVHDKSLNFFYEDRGAIVVTNPPYSDLPMVLERLVKTLDKPFIMILPTSKINTKYFREILGKNIDQIQLIIPKKRIQFDRIPESKKKNCNFDTFYYCYKMNLPKDIIFL